MILRATTLNGRTAWEEGVSWMFFFWECYAGFEGNLGCSTGRGASIGDLSLEGGVETVPIWIQANHPSGAFAGLEESFLSHLKDFKVYLHLKIVYWLVNPSTPHTKRQPSKKTVRLLTDLNCTSFSPRTFASEQFFSSCSSSKTNRREWKGSIIIIGDSREDVCCVQLQLRV